MHLKLEVNKYSTKQTLQFIDCNQPQGDGIATSGLIAINREIIILERLHCNQPLDLDCNQLSWWHCNLIQYTYWVAYPQSTLWGGIRTKKSN